MTSTHRAVLEQYLDDHLACAPAKILAEDAGRRSLFGFRVGPIRFAVACEAVGDARDRSARTARIAAAELVPPRYRRHLDAGAPVTGDILVLRGGRLEIVGCWRVGAITIAARALRERGLRKVAPWILGTVQDPPCFVLDPDALWLCYARRGP